MHLFLKSVPFLFLVIPLTGFSQVSSSKYFDKDGNEVSKENCHYYSVNYGNDTTKSKYCKTEVLRSIEVDEQGTSLFYFDNAQLRARVPILKYRPSGLVETWYPDGKKQSEEAYDQEMSESRLINYWDSTGTQLIKNGVGYGKCIFDAYEDDHYIFETGRLVDGKRDSVWLGNRADQSKYFEEKYEGGKLLAGVSFDRIGNRYEYSEIGKTAQPPVDLQSFYAFIGKTMKYPVKARRMGVEGRVYVEFVVDKKGNLQDIRCIKGIGTGCDEEAVRAVSLSKPWSPGLQRGQRVRQKMVLPITFKLS
jgi:TonB family protein